MEHSDEKIPTKRPKISDGGDGGGSEDRLSALPDDVLIDILLKLRNATFAARTSVLSSCWRHLWTLLPELNFPPANEPQRIDLALTAHGAPVPHRVDVVILHRLGVGIIDATPKSVAAWLPIAARRLSGDLCLVNKVTQNESEVMAGEMGPFELPCFENATSICLELGYLGVSMPPSGIFAKLTALLLVGVHLHGPCRLGEAVSSPRCPSLQILTVQGFRGIGNLTIHSDSLLEIELKNLAVDAPGLRNFTIHSESLKRLKLITVHWLEPTVVAPQLIDLTRRSCFSSIGVPPLGG